MAHREGARRPLADLVLRSDARHRVSKDDPVRAEVAQPTGASFETRLRRSSGRGFGHAKLQFVSSDRDRKASPPGSCGVGGRRAPELDLIAGGHAKHDVSDGLARLCDVLRRREGAGIEFALDQTTPAGRH